MNLAQRYLSSYRGLSPEVWTLSIVGLVNRMGMMVLPYLLLYLTGQMGYSPSQAGLVLGAFGLGSLAGIYLGGSLSDRIGYRRVQLGSLVSSGILLLAMGQFPAGPGLVLTIFLFGLTSDAYRPANMAAISHHSADGERSRAFGLYRLAINLGWSVGPAIGGFLALVDYEILFWIDGATTLLAAAYLWKQLPEGTRESAPEATPAPTPVSGDALTAAAAPPPVRVEQLLGARPSGSPWKDAPFLAALFLLWLQSLAFFQLSSTLPLYLTEVRGLATNVIGCLMLINTLMIVFLEMPLIARVDRFSKLRVVALSSLFMALGFGFLPWAPTLFLIGLAMVLWTIGEMLGMPMMSTWVSARARGSYQGRYMAAFGMTFSVGQITAPLFGTWTYEHLGPDWTWHATLGLGALSCLGFLLLGRRGH